MQIRELMISDAFEITPNILADDRGEFLEWYRFDLLQEKIGHQFNLRQGNISISKRGVLRGIHFAEIPDGQAKYVTCVTGKVIDFIVDIRVGSPTFGEWDSVVLDDVERKSVYLAEGLGHAFLALQDDSVVSYLVSDVFQPAKEHGISPLDPTIGLDFPLDFNELILSAKDEQAPTLAEAEVQGLLPKWEQAQVFYESLR